MQSHSIGTNRTIGTNGRTESNCIQTEPYLNEMQFTNGVPMACQVILLVPIVPLVPMDERNPALLKQNHTENSRSPLNDMQFTNGIPMECQVILLVPIVPMDERNPTVLKQNHTLMRCNSPMEYQWNAKSLYWYQSYHWYQWTSGIQLYSNRTIPKIA